jgi:hypothetical protein
MTLEELEATRGKREHKPCCSPHTNHMGAVEHTDSWDPYYADEYCNYNGFPRFGIIDAVKKSFIEGD